MKTKTKIAASLALLLSSGLASALPTIPMTIDVGLATLPNGPKNYGDDTGLGDPDTKTGPFLEIAFNQFFATSLYEKTGGIYNGNIRDTNKVPVLTDLGIPTGPLVIPTYGQTTNGNLSPLTPPFGVLNGDNEGFGTTWGLVNEYDIIGTIPVLAGVFTGVPTFNSGTWNIYFDDYTDGTYGVGGDNTPAIGPTVFNYGHDQLVLTLDLTGSVIDLTNLTLNFDLAYALPGFLSINGVDAATLLGTKFTIDTNINPPIPDPGSLTAVVSTLDPTKQYGARQTTLDGSIAPKAVPEPSSIALLGLGLMGFAAVRRKKA